MHPHVKRPSFLEVFTGLMLKSHGDSLLKRGECKEAIRMFDGADVSFKRAVASCATSATVYEAWAHVSFQLGCLLSDSDEKRARLFFDKCGDCWSQAINLKSSNVQEAWDMVSDLKIKAETCEKDGKRKISIYGCVRLYQSLSMHEILSTSPNFLYEYGDVCR